MYQIKPQMLYFVSDNGLNYNYMVISEDILRIIMLNSDDMVAVRVIVHKDLNCSNLTLNFYIIFWAQLTHMQLWIIIPVDCSTMKFAI